MSVFNTDQARHFYVTNTVEDIFVDGGEFVKIDVGSTYAAAPSDIIEKKQVEYINVTSAVNKLVRTRKKVTVGMNAAILDSGNVPAGYHFVLKLIFRQFVSNSDEDRLVKIADVYTKAAMTPANFMTALKDSIDKNLAAEESASGVTLLTRVVSSNTLVLSEAYMPWKLGKMSVATLPFDVVAEPIVIDNIEVDWATLTPAAVSKDSTDTVAGAEKLADLEWFCLGERGDIYRGIGWPNNIETKYQIDATGSTAYSIVDLTYFYMGNNEDIQHSRKTVTFACAAVDAEDAAAAFAEAFPNAIVKVDGEVYEAEAAAGGEGGGQ